MRGARGALPRAAPAPLHLPPPRGGAHWNIEAEDLALWIDPPEGCSASARLSSARRRVGREERGVAVELPAPEDAEGGPVEIQGYALYYVREKPGGACLCRRRDLTIRVEIGERGR